MKKRFNNILAAFVVAGFMGVVAVSAHAAAIGQSKKSLIGTRDANGYPVQLESDKAWKVFEVFNTTSETQVTDEGSVAPASGILHKVCVESGEETGGNFGYVLVWDTAAATGGLSVAGRRLLPPLHRVSDQQKCSDTLDVLFTTGLRVDQSDAAGATYIYWRPIGGYR